MRRCEGCVCMCIGVMSVWGFKRCECMCEEVCMYCVLRGISLGVLCQSM